jgi:hypothetical protein
VEKVVICTFTLEHHEFQRKERKTYFLAASAILFVWVMNGVILPRDRTEFNNDYNYSKTDACIRLLSFLFSKLPILYN